MGTIPEYRAILVRELESRVKRNNRYSLRAFARSLQVDPSDLSRILGGKGRVSPKMAQRLVKELGLEPKDAQSFIESVLNERMELMKHVLTLPSKEN